MTDVRVTAITRRPGSASHEGITHLAGASWRWTCEQVAASIRSGTNTFYTLRDGRRADLALGAGNLLRTQVDGCWSDDLLALPECRLHEGPVDVH